MSKPLSRALLVVAFSLWAPAISVIGHYKLDAQAQQGQPMPQSAADWLKLGIGLSRTPTNSEQAIAAFKEAIRLQPDYEAAYLQLALALRRAGQPDEQIAALVSAREISPASSEVMKALRSALMQPL